MARLPWFQFWVTDYIAETSRWSVADEGAYVRLLCAIWQNAAENDDPSLPDDMDKITDLLGISERDWERLKKKLTNRPKSPLTITEGRIRHTRITESYEHAVGLSERGRKGGIAKRDNRTLRNSTQVEPKQNSSSTQGVALQTSDMRHQTTEDMGTPTLQVSMLGSETQTCAILTFENGEEENETALALRTTTPARSNGRKQYPDAFERFWESYPNKTGKDAAYRAWRTQQRNLPDTATLTAIVRAHRTGNAKWLAGYIPNPATWLNQGRWQDALTLERQPDPLKQALAEGR